MNARENALVQKYALSFVEKVSDSSEIWNMYDQIFELITIIHDSKLNRLLLSATVSREEKATFVRTVRQSSYWQINDLIEDGFEMDMQIYFWKLLNALNFKSVN